MYMQRFKHSASEASIECQYRPYSDHTHTHALDFTLISPPPVFRWAQAAPGQNRDRSPWTPGRIGPCQGWRSRDCVAWQQCLTPVDAYIHACCAMDQGSSVWPVVRCCRSSDVIIIIIILFFFKLKKSGKARGPDHHDQRNCCAKELLLLGL